MIRLRHLLISTMLLAGAALTAQAQDGIQVARVHYGGGGDWYSGDPLPSLIEYARQHTLLDLSFETPTVELTSDNLFRYPFLYLNGHGNIEFTEREATRLQRYLTNGGFLFINDDYGLDEAIRREMKKVFPDEDFQELPASHPIYHVHFQFPDGLPKIHEHDGEDPQGLGLFHEGRLVVFYAYESDIADGWEPPEVHGDPPDTREAALRMGVNLLVYTMMQGTPES